MSDEEKPKVISLRSRAPYQAPAPEPEADPNAVDRGSILMMEELIKRFESGELSGCIIMPWHREERRFENIICIPAAEHVSEAALKYAGGLMLAHEDVLNMHVYGNEIEDAEEEYEGDE